MTSNNHSIFYEATPNPNSMKFNFGKQLTTESIFFENSSQAIRSPLAKKIFGFPWAQAIYIGPDFATITKQDWVEWAVLADPLSDLIAEHLENGEPVLIEQEQEAAVFDPNDSEDVKVIKTILNSEIRPAVAMDGGDIIFNRLEDDVVYLQMQGSCSGCPSSTMTLKMGIESRLKEALPHLKEVVSV
jgi:Fe-S cluster biogenesis protein NfuA